MKNTLLGVIAVCLFMITFKLYIPEAKAKANEVVYGDKLKRYILANVQAFCTADEVIPGYGGRHDHYFTCD